MGPTWVGPLSYAIDFCLVVHRHHQRLEFAQLFVITLGCDPDLSGHSVCLLYLGSSSNTTASSVQVRYASPCISFISRKFIDLQLLMSIKAGWYYVLASCACVFFTISVNISGTEMVQDEILTPPTLHLTMKMIAHHPNSCAPFPVRPLIRTCVSSGSSSTGAHRLVADAETALPHTASSRAR
jgi:hypothetical protein